MTVPDPEKRQDDLERLIAGIENGEFDSIEDLSREEVALLLTHARPEESLEDLFDRLKGTESEG